MSTTIKFENLQETGQLESIPAYEPVQELSSTEMLQSTVSILEEGIQQNQSQDYVTDRIFKLTQDNPKTAAEMGLPAEHLAIKKTIIEPYYAMSNPPEPAGFYDANLRQSIDVTALQQSMAVSKGPEEDGMPTYSGPYFPELKNPDPKNILGSGENHPELTKRVERLLENANRNGMNVVVYQGYRSKEEQAEIISKNPSATKAKPGFSFHNYGLAVDVLFYDSKGQPSWDEKNEWSGLGVLGKETGLEWGGDWAMQDKVHFQYPPQTSIHKIRAWFNNGGLKKLWGIIK